MVGKTRDFLTEINNRKISALRKVQYYIAQALRIRHEDGRSLLSKEIA